jgi:hypothetical protein
MSKENAFKTLLTLLAIVLAVGAIVYARVGLGMSDQVLSAWMESAVGELLEAAAVVWIAVVALVLFRARG